MLELKSLKRDGLAPVDLVVPDGECVVVQGNSGSGKTLLLRAIADLDPSEGEIVIKAGVRSGLSAPEWRRKVTYVATDAGWWSDTVGNHFRSWSDNTSLIERLELRAECRDWPVSRLSTGEKQRLSLIRALENNPEVLLLDEPTSALDTKAVLAVEQIIGERQKSGLTVIWVTHDSDQADRVADRRLYIKNGELVNG